MSEPELRLQAELALERLGSSVGRSMFSTGFTPDNIGRLVKALEKIASELAELNLKVKF